MKISPGNLYTLSCQSINFRRHNTVIWPKTVAGRFYGKQEIDLLPHVKSEENHNLCLFDVQQVHLFSTLLMHYVTTHPPVRSFPAHFKHFFFPPSRPAGLPNLSNMQTIELFDALGSSPLISGCYVTINGFGGLGVAFWPLVPKFEGSNPAEAVGYLGRKKSSARLPSEGK